MRYRFLESSVDYKNYKFGYSINAILGTNDSVEKCFSEGFLPYTGDIKNKEEIYYLARSIRVNLKKYKRLSENKRIIKNAKKKFNIKFSSQNKIEFTHDSHFLNYCLNFAKERFTDNSLSKQRLELILKRKNYNTIYTFSILRKDIGYVLAYENENIIHYWFSFYDTSFLKEFSLGKFMMEQLVYHAKKENKKYIYLGTCYGNKALYKVRDFKGIEFYDGNNWVDDIKLLKKMCKKDKID